MPVFGVTPSIASVVGGALGLSGGAAAAGGAAGTAVAAGSAGLGAAGATATGLSAGTLAKGITGIAGGLGGLAGAGQKIHSALNQPEQINPTQPAQSGNPFDRGEEEDGAFSKDSGLPGMSWEGFGKTTRF